MKAATEARTHASPDATLAGCTFLDGARGIASQGLSTAEPTMLDARPPHASPWARRGPLWVTHTCRRRGAISASDHTRIREESHFSKQVQKLTEVVCRVTPRVRGSAAARGFPRRPAHLRRPMPLLTSACGAHFDVGNAFVRVVSRSRRGFRRMRGGRRSRERRWALWRFAPLGRLTRTFGRNQGEVPTGGAGG